MSNQVETHRFEAEVSQVLKLVINSLYSNPDVFLRELVSNAADALDKRRFKALTDHALTPSEGLEIRLSADSEAGTITIADSGIGMDHDDLRRNLGTIAHSGSRAFLEALEHAQRGDLKLIGQFGVGFYSAFLVADRVSVTSRAAGSDAAWRWESSGENNFTLEPAERETAGTTIVLHLRDDRREYAHAWKLRELVRRYSDFIPYPIRLLEERWDKAETEGAEPVSRKEWTQVNRAVALWQRNPSDVKPEEYDELYRHLSHDFDSPAAHQHFRVEGTRLFDGVLFTPKRAPFDLYSMEQRGGLRLYVKRVFIMDDVKELLPPFLRFLRGVVDSDDLPLNVSREILQDSKDVRFISKQITKKALDMFERVANEKPDAWLEIWKVFGAVIKEGLHTTPEHKKDIAKLCRYRTSASGGAWASFADIRARMPEGQKAFYYITAESERAAESSPHLEALKARGYEVIFMTDPIDEWAAEALGEVDGLELVSVTRSDLELGDEKPADDEKAKADGVDADALLARFRKTLGDRVGDVRYSKRLTSSPACLVQPEGGMNPQMERILRATQPDFQGSKRILELNREHPVLRDMAAIVAKRPEMDQIDAWIEILHTQALIAEGARVEDPTPFVQRVTRLLEGAASAAAAE
jgi:molecular chaperone HtpG